MTAKPRALIVVAEVASILRMMNFRAERQNADSAPRS